MTHLTSLLSLNRAAWDAVSAEREFIAQEARRYASFYPEASDGRNTFVLFAEMIENRSGQLEPEVDVCPSCGGSGHYGDAARRAIDGEANLEPTETEKLRSALRAAVDTIQDYLAYEHDGDPWKEDSRAMGEMDINDYGRDGRLDYALSLLSALDAVSATGEA